MAAEDQFVRAAGGVPWRRREDGMIEVLVIHRARYDDWTFPKGKLDPGESWEQAAVREVWEEAAVVPVLGAEVAATEYQDRHGRPKQVRYWAMPVAVELAFRANDEVTDRQWLAAADARTRLSYDHDRGVLKSFLDHLTR